MSMSLKKNCHWKKNGDRCGKVFYFCRKMYLLTRLSRWEWLKEFEVQLDLPSPYSQDLALFIALKSEKDLEKETIFESFNIEIATLFSVTKRQSFCFGRVKETICQICWIMLWICGIAYTSHGWRPFLSLSGWELFIIPLYATTSLDNYYLLLTMLIKPAKILPFRK